MDFNNYDLMDITGLCDPSDVVDVISQYPYWIQMSIPETLVIPDEKPDIEQINSVNVGVDIIRAQVVKTPESEKDANGEYIPNLEGKISTGRKLIIEGQLCQKIVYTADVEGADQPVHSAHFYVPFSAYIVVPLEIDFTVNGVTNTVDSLGIEYQVDACVEDICVSKIDARRILKQVTMLLYAVPNQSN